ncbi:hypothetical protein AMK68_05290 [candidate division KD3-62 bacterium DG_56]|uniref:DUF1854 domain-containing protein n=1 Tax=candidate division KD3-62 bacterium DG_56 TaxID=1704032 RepID=A0A0S7XIY3_9BACT|nr:MAG: hypothetical protein AMK68_05290 [candidate division KD3-62 bacterium DG_56]
MTETDITTEEGQHLPALPRIDPARLRLFRTGDHRVRATIEGDRSYLRVSISRAFPLSDPHRYVGLRDGAQKDIGLIVEPAELDHQSRQIIDEELRRSYLLPTITRIISLKREFGMSLWEVETDRGRAEFTMTSGQDNIAELSATRLVLTDIEGGRYEIPDVRRLDSASQALLDQVL